jgi:hypothetical protein
MKVKEFIDNLLIKEIKMIQQDHGHHYVSFGLIAQGIEFLGACLDNYPYSISGKSSERFNGSIRTLFPSDYHHFVKNKSTDPFDLYGNLRCGILHIFIPGKDLEVIQESEISVYGEHLEIKNIRSRDRLILVSQRLMADFENACREVMRKIDAKEISNPKVYNDIFSASPDD